MTDFNDRRILVSGASSGIGRAIAVALATFGAKLVLAGRNEERVRETASLCGPAERSELLLLDLSRLEDIVPAVTEVASRIGRLYGLVHCAGTVQTLPLSALKPERTRAMFDVNLLAGMELMRALSHREVLEDEGGAALWIASVYAHVGAPGQIAYSATKGAIVSAVRSMALEFGPRRLRVNSLSPGFVQTPMTQGAKLNEAQWQRILAMHPLGAGQPEDVARAAVFMMDPDNRWITGSDLVIDGGYTLA